VKYIGTELHSTLIVVTSEFLNDFEMGHAYNTHGTYKSAYKILVGAADGKRSLGRPEQRWEDDITKIS
jgi:hypothetical protein